MAVLRTLVKDGFKDSAENCGVDFDSCPADQMLAHICKLAISLIEQLGSLGE